MLISLFIPFLLFWKTKISVRIIQISLLLSAFEWIRTMILLINIRIETNENWIRMAIILGFVTILNLLSIFFQYKRHEKNISSEIKEQLSKNYQLSHIKTFINTISFEN